MNSNIQGVPYKVLPLSDLNRIQEEKKGIIDTTYINEYNAIFVTIFKDGTAILSPPVLGGDEGILFFDIDAMHQMIASGKYPVKGTGTFWEQEQERIENLALSIPYYCSRLSELLDVNIELNNDPKYLKEISAVVEVALRKRKLPKNLHEYLLIYIAELTRKHLDARWVLQVEYAFHVYYIPHIVKGDTVCDVIGHIIGELELAKYIPLDIERIISDANSKFHPYHSKYYIEVKD